jgi:hypothetical protein
MIWRALFFVLVAGLLIGAAYLVTAGEWIQDRIVVSGQIIGEGAYGELYEHEAATDITVTTAGQWYGWVAATQGEITGGNVLTADVADGTADHFIVGSDGAGVYKIHAMVSFTGDTSSMTVQGAVFINSTGVDGVHFHRKLSTVPTDVGNAVASGVITLAVSDEVSFRFTSSGNGDVISPETLNLSMFRIN